MTQAKIEAPPQVQLVAALAKALPELGTVHKSKANDHFKSKYADLAAVIGALEPLAKHGVWFRQVPVDCENAVAIETFYIHESGAELSAGITTVPVDRKNAHGIGSAQTYARRYALQMAFGLAADDDDGNAAAQAAPVGAPARTKLEGPHNSKTALKKAVHEADRNIRACGDLGELEGYLAGDEFVALKKQLNRDAPEYLFGGGDLPDEFEPLKPLVDRIRHDFQQLETANQMAEYARA